MHFRKYETMFQDLLTTLTGISVLLKKNIYLKKHSDSARVMLVKCHNLAISICSIILSIMSSVYISDKGKCYFVVIINRPDTRYKVNVSYGSNKGSAETILTYMIYLCQFWCHILSIGGSPGIIYLHNNP